MQKKNITRTKPDIKTSQIESASITLAEMFGVAQHNLVCMPAAYAVGSQIAEGDLVFADSGRKPTPSDMVFVETSDGPAIKTYADLNQFNPLRLVARNGEPVSDSAPSASFTILGVVTHVTKRAGGAV